MRCILSVFLLLLAACQPSTPTDAIEGVVTGPDGPEAGVWVIAETEDLPTKYVKIVVTDDNGRDVIPELPVETQGIYAVYPPGRFTQPKVRAFIDFLVHAFGEKGANDW